MTHVGERHDRKLQEMVVVKNVGGSLQSKVILQD